MIAWLVILPLLTEFLHVLIFSCSPSHCWIPMKKLVLSVAKGNLDFSHPQKPVRHLKHLFNAVE